MKRFFKKLFSIMRSTSIITYIFAAVLIVIVVFGPLDPYEFAIGWSFSPLENPVLAQLIGYTNIVLIIAGVIILYAVFFPLIRLILHRITAYVALFLKCIKTGARMRLRRLPYASLFRGSPKGDICITSGSDTYTIHFIDIVGRARIFTLISDKQYDICKTVPDRIRGFAFGFRGGGVFIANSKPFKSRTFDLPNLEEKYGKHIIVVDPLPMEARYMDGSTAKNIYSGYETGKVVFYEICGLLKLLERI